MYVYGLCFTVFMCLAVCVLRVEYIGRALKMSETREILETQAALHYHNHYADTKQEGAMWLYNSLRLLDPTHDVIFKNRITTRRVLTVRHFPSSSHCNSLPEHKLIFCIARPKEPGTQNLTQ
jgi:hypothetical protein